MANQQQPATGEFVRNELSPTRDLILRLRSHLATPGIQYPVPSKSTGHLTPPPARKSKGNPQRHLAKVRHTLVDELRLRVSLSGDPKAKAHLAGIFSRIDSRTYFLRSRSQILLTKPTTTARPISRQHDSSVSSADDRKSRRSLYGGQGELDLDQPKHMLIGRINHSLKPDLEEEHRREYERRRIAELKSQRTGLSDTLRELQANPWSESVEPDQAEGDADEEADFDQESVSPHESLLERIRHRRSARAELLANLLGRRGP